MRVSLARLGSAAKTSALSSRFEESVRPFIYILVCFAEVGMVT